MADKLPRQEPNGLPFRHGQSQHERCPPNVLHVRLRKGLKRLTPETARRFPEWSRIPWVCPGENPEGGPGRDPCRSTDRSAASLVW